MAAASARQVMPLMESPHAWAHDLPGACAPAGPASAGRRGLASITDMPIRSARRPQPALTALLAGVLLVCAYLMSGPGHADSMRTPDAMNGTAIGAAMPAMANTSDALHGPRAANPGGDGCPSMAMECPLASAQAPAPMVFTAPGPTVLAEAPVVTVRSARSLDDLCARPRAPDPVSLLCVSRT